MANTARITQDAVELFTTQSGTVRITQDAIEFVTGVGISCGNPPRGTVGITYSHAFPAAGGTTPYVFAISAGTLPAGLTLNTSTGVVSGQPLTTGISNFTIQVTDSMGTVSSVACSIAIDPAGAPVTIGGGPYIIPRPCLCDIEELAVQELKRYNEQKEEWPYKWAYPPPGAIRVTAQNSILVPTVVAGETQGLIYTVDQGFNFAMLAIIVEFLHNGKIGAANPGDFLWSLDINKPVGIASFQGIPGQGFTNVDVQLGTLPLPWPLACPDIYDPGDVIRVKYTNVNLATSATNFFKTVLIGWRWAGA